MKKILMYVIIFFTISSCKKEFSSHVETSAIKDKTIAWMISKKTNARQIEAATIDSVMNNLNWNLTFTDQINDSLVTAYIPINSNADKRLTILYNTKQKTVDSGNLVLITTAYNRSYRNNINIYKVNFNENFTGTISIFSIKNEFENKMGFANGKKIFTAEIGTKINGESVENKNPNKKSYAENCIYHYLVVTYYNSNLTTKKEWLYQGKTCTNDSRGCEVTSINQIANESFIKISSCAGSGSGPGSPGYAEDIYDAELQAFERNYRTRMSELEKDIFDNEMNFVQRVAYLKNAQLAEWAAKAQFPSSLYNGKGDAYRHSLFIALNAKDLGPELAQRLANAHELNNNQGVLSKEMDQRNNLIGLSIYDFLNKLPTDYISYIGMLHVTIHQYLDNGNFWIINNLAEDGKETNLSRLIRSNENE
jgi:hypothetical protein